MNKKIIAVFLSVVLLICALSACSSPKTNQNNSQISVQTTSEAPSDSLGFKLSYSQSDSLSPFKSDTLNNQVVQNLVFESLFIIDETNEVQPQLATGYQYENGKTLTVTIQSGNIFSDGSAITAKNIVSSFENAKSSYRWGNSLKPISSAAAVSDTVINFKLAYKNPNAHKLLTFAIVKDETDKKGYPIGSGRYKFGEGNGSVYLKVNKKKSDFKPHFTKITLINITANESIENAINIGNISYAFRDLSEGSNAKINSNKKAVDLNNLVFIGINCNAGITKNEHIRKAISLSIDREVLVKSAYQGYAKSAVSVFTSASSIGKQTAVFESTADVSAAKQAVFQSKIEGKNLKLDILVNSNQNKNSAARLIKQQLEAVGFKVSINKVTDKNYKSKIKNRSFDLYIGETKIPADMNLSSFFTEKGETRYGINLSGNCAKAYKGYLDSKNEIGTFILNFSQEMPFIPLLYRQGMICYSKSLHGDMQGYVDNYFSNIQDWYYN